MNWLVWKEYRLNRFILIVAATLLVMPHAIALGLAWYGVGLGTGVRGSSLATNLLVSALYSVILSQLTLALIGGNAIACERADRSAEFLAYLPLSRAKILSGKMALALAAAGLIWVPNLAILHLASTATTELPPGLDRPWSVFGYAAVTGFTFFAVGWLLSSCVEKPAIAIVFALMTPFLIQMATMSLALTLGHGDDFVGIWYVRVCLTAATACLLAGTWYYVRRVEP